MRKTLFFIHYACTYACIVVSSSARFLSTVRKVSIDFYFNLAEGTKGPFTSLGTLCRIFIFMYWLPQYSSSVWMLVSSVDIKLTELASTADKLDIEATPTRKNACTRLSKTLKRLPKEKTYCLACPVLRLRTRISSPFVQVWLARQRER